jgi:hypothetical protein
VKNKVNILQVFGGMWGLKGFIGIWGYKRGYLVKQGVSFIRKMYWEEGSTKNIGIYLSISS